MDNKSYWQLEAQSAFSPLNGDLTVHTVIVGGGMCGLLCAYALLQKGVTDIALIDAEEICSGVTAHTTAKITAQHGLLYAKLMRGMGEDPAKEYAAAQTEAIRQFAEIIEKERIDCDFTPCNAWVYTTDESKLQDIKDEVQAAQKLGISASFETESELPFPITGAVRFANQARFHPLKFTKSICDILAKSGCKIFTHTKATGAHEGVVYTDKGNINAQNIISCSHYPFIDKHSLLFTKIYQERSYVLALKGAGSLRDMYLDCEDGGYSLRAQKDCDNEDMILFGAFDHKSGHEDKKLHFKDLIARANALYPNGSVAYQWSAQDCMTHDSIPYIGRYESAGRNIYLATGFHKWGMTSSMAAAQILGDMITKGSAKNASVFSLGRRDVAMQAKSFVKEAVDIAGNFLTHLTMADKSLQSIGHDQGGIVEIDGKRVGVYVDKSGNIHAIKPMCTHMGCAVKWNKDENTWDCTCHGSRFDAAGNVIGGPALKPLEQYDMPNLDER